MFSNIVTGMGQPVFTLLFYAEYQVRKLQLPLLKSLMWRWWTLSLMPPEAYSPTIVLSRPIWFSGVLYMYPLNVHMFTFGLFSKSMITFLIISVCIVIVIAYSVYSSGGLSECWWDEEVRGESTAISWGGSQGPSQTWQGHLVCQVSSHIWFFILTRHFILIVLQSDKLKVVWIGPSICTISSVIAVYFENILCDIKIEKQIPVS